MENYPYDLYEVEFVPEVLYGVAYRKSLTTLFPRFLKVMAKYHEEDICRYFKDVFGFEGSVEDSVRQMIELFESLGVDMYFDGEISEDALKDIDISTGLSAVEVTELIRECLC